MKLVRHAPQFVLISSTAAVLLSCTNDQMPVADGANPVPDAADGGTDAGGPGETDAPPATIGLTVETVDSGPCENGQCVSEDVGSYDSEVCLLTRLSGVTESYGDDYRYSCIATQPYLVEWQGGLDTSARLFVYPTNRIWHLDVTSEDEAAVPGLAQRSCLAVAKTVDANVPQPSRMIEADSFSASVTCLPWSALGFAQPPAFTQVNVGGSGSSTPLPPDAACFLSEITDDFSSGTADLTSGSLFLTTTGDSGSANMWAAATCFSGVHTVDVPLVDHGALPAGLCGLAAVGGLRSNQSNVDVGEPIARLTDASGTARCILAGSNQ